MRTLTLLALLLAAPQAHAKVDIELKLTAPPSAAVYAMTRYDLTVRNVGKRTASDVTVRIDLPLTQTSPTRHVMGGLGSMSAACARIDDHLECALGDLRKRTSAGLWFELALPAIHGPDPQFSAEAATTSRERELGNNAVSWAQPIDYVATAVAAPRDAHNRHCTGAQLSSFFECSLYPSSISSHDIRFESGGGITFVNPAAPGYTGQWGQPAPDELSFYYVDGNNDLVLLFQGFGAGGDCFEGTALLPQSPPYIAGYEVCLQ